MTEKSCRNLLVLILFFVFCIVPAFAQAFDYWSPWVTQTTTNSTTINWRSDPNDSAEIYYDTTSYFNQHNSFEYMTPVPIAAQYQHVQITGLEPNTSYTYWVRPSGDPFAFGNRTFLTMPVSGPFTFIVVGDTREGAHYMETKRFKYVADAIANESNVLFILHLGDFSRFDNDTRWAIFFQCADRMLANSTIFPVIGNHEYHNLSNENLDEENYNVCPEKCLPCNNCSLPTAAVNYHSAFDMPLNCSFDCAGVRFVVLNSPDVNYSCCDDPQTSTPLAESQAPWLQQQLDSDMLGTFTMHHHPIWDYGCTTMNFNLSSWETLYHTYNISANFAGHTHNYQRYNVSGIPYFLVGNGGAKAVKFNSTDPHPIWYVLNLSMQLGYLRVTVDPANNTATAWEITVGKVTKPDDNETPQLYNPPVINDTITFPLKVAPNNPQRFHAGKTINNEQITMGSNYAEAYVSGSATNNIAIVTSQEPRKRNAP